MRGVLLIAAALGLVAGLAAGQPAILPGDPDWARGAGSGALVAIAGGLLGAFVIRRHLGGEPRRFLVALLGTMLGRLVAFGMAVGAVAIAGAPPLGGFLCGLIGAHVALQATEVVSLHRQAARGLSARTGGPE